MVLLSEGPQNDKIDAVKLCQLLRAGLLKEIYHSLEEDYHLRKLVSAYEACEIRCSFSESEIGLVSFTGILSQERPVEYCKRVD